MQARTTIVRDATDGDSGEDGQAGGIRLLVIGADSYETYDLPSAGTVSLGRSDTNDIRIDDAQASRSHARLILGDTLMVEDLGSVNGTRVRERPIARGEKVPIQPGETIAIGSSVLILHVRSGRAPGPATADSPTFTDTSLGQFPVSGPDEAMRTIHHLAERAAAGTINVLILGETGVGKEVMARAVHRLSPRRAGPYVCLNCAALSESLLESELFGHERGAFTGALGIKPGLLETAAGGTLFLDEVGELPPAIQAKLLRVLETREVTRVGSVRPRQIDVRFVAATNRDLETEAERGTFRRDLYFRLQGISIRIPPLRERRSEIRSLADTFLRQVCQELRRPEPRLTPAVLEALHRREWPGNIRELRNVIERAVLLCTGNEIGVEHLPEERLPRQAAPVLVAAPEHTDPRGVGGAGRYVPPAETRVPPRMRARSDTPPELSKAFAEDKQRILDALATCAGNQSRAAKLLGMPRRTFVARLDRYQIARPKKNNANHAADDSDDE
ncbi:MAG: sigma 54-interacting transcriptional regulator [Bacteroidota bacterium]